MKQNEWWKHLAVGEEEANRCTNIARKSGKESVTTVKSEIFAWLLFREFSISALLASS